MPTNTPDKPNSSKKNDKFSIDGGSKASCGRTIIKHSAVYNPAPGKDKKKKK